MIPPIALPHVSGGSGKDSQGKLGSYVQTVIDNEVKEAVLDAALHNTTALINQMIHPYKGIFFGSKGTKAHSDAFNRIFDGVRASDIVKDGKLTPEAQAYFKDYLPRSPPPKLLSWQVPDFLPSESRKPSKQMMEGMRLMAGSYVLGGLSNLGSGQTWEESPVSKGIGAVAGAASSGMMAGGAAAMMGLGPIGIGLAAVVPVVQELSKAIGEI